RHRLGGRARRSARARRLSAAGDAFALRRDLGQRALLAAEVRRRPAGARMGAGGCRDRRLPPSRLRDGDRSCLRATRPEWWPPGRLARTTGGWVTRLAAPGEGGAPARC